MSLKKILLIPIFYILIGSIIFESLDEKLFQFLYLNGFDTILKFILIGNDDKLLNHIILADRNFYNIYFGFGLSLLSFFLIYNFFSYFTTCFLKHIGGFHHSYNIQFHLRYQFYTTVLFFYLLHQHI